MQAMLSKINLRKHALALLLLASLLSLVVNEVLPPKQVMLFPREDSVSNLYGYSAPDQGPSSRWINQAEHEWSCIYEPHYAYGCGSNIGWGESTPKTLDLSQFDHIEAEVEYTGDSPHLRFILRNHDPAYSTLVSAESGKQLSVLVTASELNNQHFKIDLSHFSVSRWWITENKIHRRWTSPERNRITAIGIEVIEPSRNLIKIKRVAAYGKWIQFHTLLALVLTGWMSYFLYQGAIQFYLVYTRSKKSKQKLEFLRQKQEELEQDKAHINRLSKFDPLTEIVNRRGFYTALEALKNEHKNTGNTHFWALLILDLDHFKLANDRFGHVFGDNLLKAFVQNIQRNIPQKDLFARWGGEEFVILCSTLNRPSVKEFAEALRHTTEHITVKDQPNYTCSVSIGVTHFLLTEAFDEVFKRADKALYDAKQRGRNCVRFFDSNL